MIYTPRHGAPDLSTPQRRELGAFLREKRGLLTPQAAGLPPGTRRRTPGLRREEVAQLAGVSVAWYTWLEQGRTIHPSAATLGRVLDALRCAPEDRTYVQRLLHAAPAPPTGTRDWGWDPQLQEVLDAFLPSPALLLDRHWQRLAQNANARHLNFLPRPDEEVSILDVMFLHPESRSAVSNWPEQARHLVATFRLDSSTYPDDEWFAGKVRDLSARSPEFAQFWAERQVREHRAQSAVVRHPQFGELELHLTWMQVLGAPHLKLLLCTVAAGTPSPWT